MSKLIVLGDINKDTLLTYLNSLNNSTECEIRFGNFIYSEGNQKPDFVASVEIDFFHRLKQILNKQKNLEKKHVYTKEISYKNADDKKGKLREIIHTNDKFTPIGKTEYMVKNTHRQHNIFDYNCRISLSSEKILTRVDGVSMNEPMFFRFKNRVSYMFNSGVLDMTIVHQGKTEEEAMSKQHIQYEVEFEIKKQDYDSILQIISFIMSVRQDNLYVMNTREKRNIINQYRSLVMPHKKGHPYFIGAQPETLQKDQLSHLFKELYSVTDKADGERYFMFVDAKGYVSFIDNNINNILKTDVKSEKHINCLIDGELIRTTQEGQTSKISFYAFDIVFYNGKDLRGDEQFLLKQRLEVLNSVIQELPSNNYYDIQMKKFIYRNVFMGSDIIMKNVDKKPYKNDGLIFTPMNEPYPKSKKWIKLLKWKPAELNTIDFFSVKEDNVWKLYVQDSVPEQSADASIKRKTNLVLFDVHNLCGVPETTQITFETTFDDSILDPTTNEPFQTNTVIEYQWQHDKFVPLRTRWDKTANPSKHGNFSSVACSIWNNINNPITPSQLFQMTNTTTEQVSSDKNFFFERMSNFHTKINQFLTNKYVPNNLTTSECDKDINYNMELNTCNVVKIDNTFTFCNSIKSSNINYKNFKLDLTNENSPHIIKNSIQKLTNNNINISTIFCLKFNSFVKSLEDLNNFMNIVDYNIKPNGKLVLTFIELKQLQSLNQMDYINNNEIMYSITNFDKVKDVPFNNSVKMFINGISNENDPIEYLVDFEALQAFMSNKGYKLVETESYKKLYDMFIKSTSVNNQLRPYEINISNLYRYCVFEKIESKVMSTIVKKSDMTMSRNSLIEHQNLEFVKIHNSYDIYNLLNCINFTVFKKMYDNVTISSFDDISNVLTICDKVVPYFKGANVSKQPMMYFHNYYFEEPSEDPETEPVIVNQFYVILFKGSLLQTQDTIIEIDNLLSSAPIEPVKEPVKEPIKEEDKEKDSNKIRIKNEVDKLGNKITVVLLKEYLKELNLKTTGKKDELLERLKTNLI